MDARELTKCYYEHNDKIIALQSDIEILKQDIQILRLKLEDAKVDIEMLERWTGGR